MQRRKNKPKSSPRSYALWLLGRQTYTASRLRDRLIRRGYSSEEAGDAIAYLLEIGYLDDAAYATNYVTGRSLAGNGPRKLRWELKSRGVNAEIIDDAISQVPHQTLFEQAERLAERRLRGKDRGDPKVIAGTYRYLVQRGYDYALVEDVVQKVIHHLDSGVQNS